MATVRKCDICGKVYGQYPKADETIMLISAVSKNDKFSSGVYGEKETDCCPECTEKILSFIDILKTYPTRYIIEITSEEV